MYSIIMQSFNLVGHVMREEIKTEDFKRRAPTAHPGKKSQNQRLSDFCASMTGTILQRFNLVGHVISEEIKIEDFKRRNPTAPPR